MTGEFRRPESGPSARREHLDPRPEVGSVIVRSAWSGPRWPSRAPLRVFEVSGNFQGNSGSEPCDGGPRCARRLSISPGKRLDVADHPFAGLIVDPAVDVAVLEQLTDRLLDIGIGSSCRGSSPTGTSRPREPRSPSAGSVAMRRAHPLAPNRGRAGSGVKSGTCRSQVISRTTSGREPSIAAS